MDTPSSKTFLITLFLAVTILHVAVIFTLQSFNPFASITSDSADYQEYQEQAEIISARLSQGNFSIKDLGTDHYYPVIVGYLHFIFGGSPILLGQILNAIISGLSAILLFLIIRQIGGSKSIAFWLSLAGSIYPSHLLLSSLFLEDAAVILLTLATLFWSIKILRAFSVKNTAIWYALIIFTATFRSFMGLLLGLAFFFSYLLFYQAEKREKIKKLILLALLIFFISFIAELITRMTGFMAHGHSLEWIFQMGYPGNFNYHYSPDFHNFEGWFFNGWYSGVLPIAYSSLWALLGPFPWNLHSWKESLYLLEVIPWLLAIPFIYRGIEKAKASSSPALVLAVFAGLVLFLTALYVDTREMEIMMRLRVPALLSLLPFFALGIKKLITTENETKP